jgi:hypothetical protein
MFVNFIGLDSTLLVDMNCKISLKNFLNICTHGTRQVQDHQILCITKHYLQWIRSLYIAREAEGVWDTTTVNADTPVSLFRWLPDLELFSSTAEASGFPEYNHPDSRNSYSTHLYWFTLSFYHSYSHTTTISLPLQSILLSAILLSNHHSNPQYLPCAAPLTLCTHSHHQISNIQV